MEHTTQQKDNTMATDNNTRPTTREPQTPSKNDAMNDGRAPKNTPAQDIQRPEKATTVPAKQQPETMEKEKHNTPQDGNSGYREQSNSDTSRPQTGNKDQRGSNY